MFSRLLFKKQKEARGLKILCLCLMVLCFVALFVPHMVQAQPTPLYARPSTGSTGSTNDAAMAQMEIRLQQMENQVRDLTGKVEEQSYEINRLKALNEGLAAARESQAEKSQEQIRRPVLDLNPPTSAGMKTAIVGSSKLEATTQYEQAFAALKSNQFDEARQGFESFLEQTPEHVLAPNAKYWLGETYYAQSKFKDAAKAFAEGFQAFPKSAKSPDILLKLGMSLAKLGKTDDACVALSQLSVKFPTGPEGVLQMGEKEMADLGCGG